MLKEKFGTREIVLLAFITFAVAMRVIAPLLPGFAYLANFSAIGAAALFGGSYFSGHVKAFGFPVMILLVSDILLNLFVYKLGSMLYEGWYFTYIAFILMVLAGRVMLKKVNFVNVFAASLAAVFIHWIVADFGVWLGSSVYPQTLTGFWACLEAAIPFERNFLIGTLVYSGVLFGAFELLKAKYPALQVQPVKA